MRSQLDGDIGEKVTAEAVLLISELVTNSVVHARIGTDQQLCLELTRLDGALRIAVIDSGSPNEPRIRQFDPALPGGFGLRIVDEMSSAWGFVREAQGRTRVWCDLPLGAPITRSALA